MSWQKASKVCDLDLSYMSLQKGVNAFNSKFAFFPAVFKESFELHLIPFK